MESWLPAQCGRDAELLLLDAAIAAGRMIFAMMELGGVPSTL
jgi:hypothetical protein